MRLRPRFEYVAPIALDEASRRLRAVVGSSDLPCRVDVFRGHAVFHVNAVDEHLWSPFLSVDVNWHPNGTVVRGIYGPKPSIWSLFVAAYAICIFLALFAAAFGFSQWMLDQTPSALVVVGSSVLCIAVTYGLALYGQRKGDAQMSLLRATLEDVLSGANTSI